MREMKETYSRPRSATGAASPRARRYQATTKAPKARERRAEFFPHHRGARRGRSAIAARSPTNGPTSQRGTGPAPSAGAPAAAARGARAQTPSVPRTARAGGRLGSMGRRYLGALALFAGARPGEDRVPIARENRADSGTSALPFLGRLGQGRRILLGVGPAKVRARKTRHSRRTPGACQGEPDTGKREGPGLVLSRPLLTGPIEKGIPMSRLAWIARTALLLPLLAPVAPAAPAAPAAKTYKIDPVHSSALFRIKHNNASYFHGRFTDIAGTFAYDEANPAGSSVEVTIKAESVWTGAGKRDQHLKSPDFFNAEEFPALAFKSKGVKKGSGKEELEVTGDLTIHGVTKPLTAKVTHTGTAQGQGGEVAGFETVFTIKRTDFDMKNMVGMLGDEVQITISLEGGKQ